jgi:hypothetical protein
MVVDIVISQVWVLPPYNYPDCHSTDKIWNSVHSVMQYTKFPVTFIKGEGKITSVLFKQYTEL